ncbi:MAG: dihydrodipicolinate synthase family protein [Promethearchaeota archaeon]
MTKIKGVICNTITFYDRNFKIIEKLNSLLFRHILTNDANGLLLFGSIGDGILFSDKIEEKIKLINLALKITEKQIPLLIGVYGASIDDVINQIEHLRKHFDDLNYLISPPISEKFPVEDISAYFENILGSISPKSQVYLYNDPNQFARNEIDPKMLENLTEFSNLKGLNDSFYNIKNCKSYLTNLSKDFSVFCGLEENFKDFFQLIPINQRKDSGIIPNLSNLVNMCSKLYYYALEDNILELLQLQEEINDVRAKIYDSKIIKDREKRGLKYAFLHLYKELIPQTDEQVNFVASNIESDIESITQERIGATVHYLINRKYIYQLYPIGTKDLYQFHDIIKTFSQVDILVQQGKVKKITGPYASDVNTIYRVKFENNQLVFRFRTSKFFQFENLVKQKLLFPFLDKSLSPDDLELRHKVINIISKKTGAYIFKKDRPPVIPVSNLTYYDESKEIIPYIFSVQEYIRGKPLFQLINRYVREGKNLDTNKFINLFGKLGEYLGNLHQVKFDSFYKTIKNVGKKKKIPYSEFFNNELENEIQEAKKNKISFGSEIQDYYRDNQNLLEEENEFVLLHNDFHSQNVIVKEEQGVININGIVDFDNWCIGSRTQDFIKIDYLILKPLNIPSLNSAFYETYSKYYRVDRDFKKKIEIHKLLWLLNEYNFESELKRKSSQNDFTSTTLSSLENYLFEIKAIVR